MLSNFSEEDLSFMRRALQLAEHAARLGEVPVGAVLVKNGLIIGEGWNAPICNYDASHHAEVAAIRDACSAVHNYRLPDTTLYVTLEPCTMCFGAIVHARIGRIVFAAKEPRAGVLVSQLQLPKASFYNHHIKVQGGLCADESASLLTQFFRARRGTSSAVPE